MIQAKAGLRADVQYFSNQITQEPVALTFDGLHEQLKSLAKSGGWLDRMEQTRRALTKTQASHAKTAALALSNELVKREVRKIYNTIRRMSEVGLLVQHLPLTPLARGYTVDQARDLISEMQLKLEQTAKDLKCSKVPKKRGPKEHGEVLKNIKLYEDWKASGLSKPAFLKARGLRQPKAIHRIEAGRKAYNRRHSKPGRI